MTEERPRVSLHELMYHLYTIRVSIMKEEEEPEDKEPALHRFAREIAKELIDQYGTFAYVQALDRLDHNVNPELWRDVLTAMDKLDSNDKLNEEGKQNVRTDL